MVATVRRSVCAALIALALLEARPALAHTGFPEVRQILLPMDRPERITLATNFGLLLSDDAGKSFRYSCERGSSSYAARYALGAGTSNRIFALTGDGVTQSDDHSCSWTATTSSSDVLPFGFAVDAADADRVYVFGVPRGAASGGDRLYISRDGGRTLGEPTFTTAAGDMIMTIMPAPAQPGTLFMALFSAERGPILLQSAESAESWEEVAVAPPALAPHPFELVAIYGERLFARVLEGAAETLAISEDAGRTFTRALSIPGKLAAVVQLASGTVLVGGTVGNEPIGYRSTDGARSFEPWREAPRVHALAERSGKLYVAADNFLDGYVLAESSDEGAKLEPLLHFSQVRAVDGCVGTDCAEACAYYADLGLWPRATCGSASPEPDDGPAAGTCASSPDPVGGAGGMPAGGAGSSATGEGGADLGSAGAGSTAGDTAGDDADRRTALTPRGGSCALPMLRERTSGAALPLLALVLVRRWRKRRLR